MYRQSSRAARYDEMASDIADTASTVDGIVSSGDAAVIGVDGKVSDVVDVLDKYSDLWPNIDAEDTLRRGSVPSTVVGVATDRRTEIACRVSDVLVASCLIIALSPLILIITILVAVSDGGPPFFVQTRIGRAGVPFACIKFRSMGQDAEERLKALLRSDADARREWEHHQKLIDDPRVTRVGAFLRKASLDELPQLIHVLRGEMSLVGPRPIVADEIARYGRWIGAYYALRPGITGLWQVRGRSGTSYRRRVALDVAYARNQSIALYYRILLATVWTVLRRSGAC